MLLAEAAVASKELFFGMLSHELRTPFTPLVAILELVESIDDTTPVIVHHERDPQMLYPELAEIGWRALRIDGEPGEVRLKLERVR